MRKKFKIAIPELPIERSDLPAWILEECELLEGEKGVRGDNSQLLKFIGTADAIIFNSSNSITADLMKKAPELKVAFKSGAWPENIDFSYARMNGIAVGWTPEANAQSVAEYTVLLMLAACKRFIQAADALLEDGWRDQTLLGGDISGKTIGIIGLGAIGRKVASILKGFQSCVIAYDPYMEDAVFERENIKRVSFEELLKQADVVSIHCLLTDDTKGMFNEDAFKKMKSSAILVNSARGGMIDETALIDALRNGEISGAALDVYAKEPLAMDHPLRTVDNIIMTPHVAARTKESAYRECVWAIQGALDYLHGREINNATIIYPDKVTV